MKAFLISIVFLVLQISLSAQNRTYHFEDIAINEVIEILENDYSTLFSYKSELLQDQVVSKSIVAENLEDVLTQLFDNSEIDFIIIDNSNVLLKAKVKQEEITICGQVFSELDHSPLAFVNVIHPESGMGTTTDESGLFRLSATLDTEDVLQISYIGFESQIVPVQYFLSAKNCLEIHLDLPENMEAFLVIKDYMTDGIDLKDQLSATEINIQKAGMLPGQVEPDVLTMVQFLPGVNSPSAKASDLYIRGCSPDQNLISWEGIPIYHSAHYFGMLSAFNPFSIHSMNIYRGGFDADYGGRIASIIQMESPDESNRSSHGGLGSNMTHGYAYAHKVFNTKNPASINLSIRRSFQEVWESPTFRNISKVNQQGFIIGNKELAELPDNISISNDFNFTDAQLKVTKQLNKSSRIEFAGLYANNDFNDRIEDQATSSVQEDKFDLRNLGASIKFQKSWSDKVESLIKAMASSYEYDYLYTLTDVKLDRIRAEGQKSNRISDIQFNVDNTFNIDAESSLKFGYQLTNYDIDFRVEEKASSQGNNVNDNGEDKAKLHSLYANYAKLWKDKLGLKVGLRSSYYGRSKSIYFEPRLNLSYKLSDRLSLRSNLGWYSQFIGQVTEFRGSDTGFSFPLWAISENMSIPVLRSRIFQTGIIFKQNSLTIDLQSYVRHTDGLSSRAYSLLLEAPNAKPENGDANIFGVDLLVKKRFGNFRSWVSYAYSTVDFKFDKISNEFFPADYDQRHVLQLVNQYKSNQHTFGLGFKVSSGLPYSTLTDFKITSMQGQALEYQAEYDGINGNRLPYNYELNFSYEYRFDIGEGMRGYISGSFRNILNRENIFERNYSVFGSESNPPEITFSEKANLKFTPNISARIEW